MKHEALITKSVTKSAEEKLNRPLEGWKYVYVASAIDFGSNMNVSIIKSDSRKFGYKITPNLLISNRHRGSLEFINEFCNQHELQPKVRKDNTSYRLEVGRRDDIEKVLKLVKPYLIARHKVADILIERLIPKLNEGLKTKRDFYRAVKVADKIREETSSRGKAKYDQEYFKQEWKM